MFTIVYKYDSWIKQEDQWGWGQRGYAYILVLILKFIEYLNRFMGIGMI